MPVHCCPHKRRGAGSNPTVPGPWGQLHCPGPPSQIHGPGFTPAACPSTSSIGVSPLLAIPRVPAPQHRGDMPWPHQVVGSASGLCGHCQGHLLPPATTTHPADDQSFLANTTCAVLQLVSYTRRMVGVPNTGEPCLWGCSSPPLPWQQHQRFVPSPVGCHTGSPWGGRSGEVGSPQLTMPAAPTPSFSRCH